LHDTGALLADDYSSWTLHRTVRVACTLY